MNEALNILLVDDNPDDRALVMRELSRELPTCQFRAAIDSKDFSKALESGPWAAVITDYQLRWSDGIGVLLAVKVRWPDCPVIMFTGSGNEEIAVQAMKAGLDDYVLKSPKHYARLPAATLLALDRAKQRRALLEAETRYQSLFDDVPVGLFRVASDGRIVDANPALLEMLSYPYRETMAAIKAVHFFADIKERHELLKTLKQSGIVRLYETRFYRVDRSIIWAEVNVRVIRDDKGQVLCYEGTLEDITGRKQAELSLRESEARKGAILDSAFDAIITIDHEGKIIEFNHAAQKIFNRIRLGVIGHDLAEIIIPPALRDKFRRDLQDYRATGRGIMLDKLVETTAIRDSGKEFPVEFAVTKVGIEGPAMFTLFARDITERKRAEKQLKDSREQLRALAAYLQSVREEERARIAREVHDELGQALTGLKMDLAWLDKKMTGASETEDLVQMENKLRELPGRVDAIIGTVRKIATELRPPVLDDLGLEAAVEWQVQEFEKRTAIKCRFKSNVRRLDLDQERATAVFRIFQETLTNIVRHADATEVNINLREEGDKLILEVQDNGRGMTGRELSGTRSLGLLGMRERATMLDGEVNIIGRQGQGTTVGVLIPIPRSSEGARK